MVKLNAKVEKITCSECGRKTLKQTWSSGAVNIVDDMGFCYSSHKITCSPKKEVEQ